MLLFAAFTAAVSSILLLLVFLGKAIDGEAGEDGDLLSTSRMEMDDEGNLIVTRPKISGKIKLTYDADKPTEQAMEVDADAYMSELRGQVGVVVHENVYVDVDAEFRTAF